ncbi:MAG: helix-hairpin-helix domain-containing protein [Candidatus Omnitrophica bacterium]|nr:helix-hairpin-helix domain-containing protein [Candidatus Omnitrophota bacterium]
MFNLEKREKFILLALLAILLAGLILGLYRKKTTYVDIKSNNFAPLEESSGSLTGQAYSAEYSLVETPRININESDAAELMKLKGVGKVLAGRIVEYRSTNGNFRSVEELRKVKGVGKKLYEKIKDGVSIE